MAFFRTQGSARVEKRRLCRACLRVGFGLGPFQDDLWDNGGLLCVGFTARVESPIGGPCEARSQSQHGASNNQKATLAVIPRGRGWTRFALRVKTNAGRAWRPSLPQILWGKWGYAPVCSRPVCVFPKKYPSETRIRKNAYFSAENRNLCFDKNGSESCLCYARVYISGT